MWKVPRVTSGVGSPEAIAARVRRTEEFNAERERRQRIREEERLQSMIKDVSIATGYLQKSAKDQENMDRVDAFVYAGSPVQITDHDYREWGRAALQNLAGRYLDYGDSVRSLIALQEVRRLDKEYRYLWELL